MGYINAPDNIPLDHYSRTCKCRYHGSKDKPIVNPKVAGEDEIEVLAKGYYKEVWCKYRYQESEDRQQAIRAKIKQRRLDYQRVAYICHHLVLRGIKPWDVLQVYNFLSTYNLADAVLDSLPEMPPNFHGRVYGLTELDGRERSKE